MSAGTAAATGMEGAGYNLEKDSVIIGGLFQTIINDLRGSSPIWEDFTYKSVKLHASLKTTVVAVGAFLEAFQKVADMATSSKGATREIGSALTRLCMRHRSIESHLKSLTSTILDNLVAPLQDKLEDWKKTVAQLDKDHSRENKKAKQDIKKAASDTIRLQKKVRKGSTHGKSDMQQKLDSAMLDVNSKYHQLEVTEKNSVRSALIEERSRFCLFITCLKPFVDQELKLLTEMTHINEIMESLCMQASEPLTLPASSEQVILDLKGVDTAAFSFSQAYQQSSPPSSPSSLGSRKSSMCSINSINSSSSGSSHSPSHTIHNHHAYAQPPPSAVRLTSVSSQDSGFTSQDTLFLCLSAPRSLSLYQGSESQERDECDSTPTTPSDNTPSASSTWNNWPNMPGNARMDQVRPHTISSAYEKGHSRPALKPDIFEPPQEAVEMRPKTLRSQSQGNSRESRPSATISKLQPVLPPHCPKPKIKAVAPPMLPPGAQPIYANMSDLAQKGSQSDLSPDDGEPTTPTTPASTSVSLGEFSSEPPSSSLPLVVVTQPVQRMTALDLAMEQMDICTASLNLGRDQASDISEPATPRSSTDDLSQEQPDGAGLSGERAVTAGDVEMVVECPRVKIQQNTSLELAKAIQELQASTAALTSAYGSEPYGTVSNHAAVTSTTAATSDTDSYTSKMSLQCSSGYGTMNNTPAGSEDTIASGGISESIAECAVYEELEEVVREDCEVLDDRIEAEKYYTIPRSGEMRAAYRAALHAQRPASTTGILVAGGGIVRRSSMSSQKPPPPIRRTASVSGPTPHFQIPIDRQLPADGHDPSYAIGGGEGLVESPYAELHVIQQSIHNQNRPQLDPASHYQRQTSAGDQPAASLGHIPQSHDAGGGGQFNPVNLQGHMATASAIQSLNAKFASLNSQYQDEHGSDDAGNTRGLVQKPAPQVMQKPNKNAFPPPPSAMAAHPEPLYQHAPPTHGGPPGPSQGSHPQNRNKYHGIHPHQQLQHQLARQMHQQKYHQQQQQSLYSEPNSYQQHHMHVLAAHPEEDFPLPPTQEELQEIERVYSRQLPSGQIIRALTPQHSTKQTKQVPQPATTQQLPQQHQPQPHQPQQHQTQQHKPQQHQPQQHQPQQQHPLPHQAQHYHQQQQYRHQQQQHQLHQQQLHLQQQQQHSQQQQQRHHLQQPQDVQASLLMELKKRVSIDDSTDA